MTSCKLRVKLRVDYYKKNSADSCESALMRTSVTRPLFNMREKPTLLQNLRAKLRALFFTF